ncbi:uncharacterized protein LOC129571160 isoform X2 [Sitodiplosis mosellana]|uniref:uncharacterized protein LOC129571160 isoform X2 n=1 Tax=Sitodiplosis mosellana TaxID=263140 RepID=UPI002444E19E|nr:uncharacterized protein LOC129571160 isoform X2 [Sitodiplosis mosellana]
MNGLLKVHKETCRLYVNKEIKVNVLEKKKFPQDSRLLYESFEDEFGKEVIIKLRKLQNSISSDSTLILNCVKSLFRNTEELKSMSACGQNKNVQMPREKREKLDAIFLERLSSIEMKDDERNMRYHRLNRLINTAIGNILKAQGKEISKTKNTEINASIHNEKPANEVNDEAKYAKSSQSNATAIFVDNIADTKTENSVVHQHVMRMEPPPLVPIARKLTFDEF